MLPKRNPALCRSRVGFDTKAENAHQGEPLRRLVLSGQFLRYGQPLLQVVAAPARLGVFLGQLQFHQRPRVRQPDIPFDLLAQLVAFREQAGRPLISSQGRLLEVFRRQTVVPRPTEVAEVVDPRERPQRPGVTVFGCDSEVIEGLLRLVRELGELPGPAGGIRRGGGYRVELRQQFRGAPQMNLAQHPVSQELPLGLGFVGESLGLLQRLRPSQFAGRAPFVQVVERQHRLGSRSGREVGGLPHVCEGQGAIHLDAEVPRAVTGVPQGEVIGRQRIPFVGCAAQFLRGGVRLHPAQVAVVDFSGHLLHRHPERIGRIESREEQDRSGHEVWAGLDVEAEHRGRVIQDFSCEKARAGLS